MFILAMIKGCWTYKTFTYKALDAYDFLKRHVNKTTDDLVELSTVTLGDMTDYNWTVVQSKAESFEWTLRFVTVGALAFGVGFLLLMFALAFPTVCLRF